MIDEIQVTTEGSIGATAKDLVIEGKLKAKLLFAKGVASINYRWRAVNGIVYLLGLARTEIEHAKVLTILRDTDGVDRIVDHTQIAG